MATDHLQIPDIQANQNQKEVTANAAHNLLDRAINQVVPKAISGSTSLTTTESRENTLVILTGTPGAPFNLDMPDTNERKLWILNNTDSTVTVRNSAGGGTGQPSALAGLQVRFHYDGTDFTVDRTGAAIGVLDEGVSVVSAASLLNYLGEGVSVSDAGRSPHRAVILSSRMRPSPS